MLSMDIHRGYYMFRLHPAMRDWFLFHYGGRYFRCVGLPLGWGNSALWFMQLLTPFVTELRRYGYRVLWYLDDFLIVPSPLGSVSTSQDCTVKKRKIPRLLERLGLVRHPTKGEWNGAKIVERLGVTVNTEELRFYVTKSKAAKVEEMSKKLLRTAKLGRRWVLNKLVTPF